MSYSLVLGVVAFLIAVLAGHPFVALMRRYKVGKRIRIDGPSAHVVKAGTPTMGGLLVAGTVVVLTTVFNLVGRYSILLPAAVLASSAALGAVDDALSLMNAKPGGGLTLRFKLAWLLAIATAAGLVLHFLLKWDIVYLPGVRSAYHIGFWFVPLAILAIAGTANAVNLTDGLDSLAGVTSAVAFASYGVIAYLQEQYQLVTFCFTVVGAIVAFLWFNAHPAEIFMGDTGSLSLGATLAVVALMTGQVLLLPVIGIVFVAEALSDIVQVAYFKLTGGKRLLKMAPLHHHFELLGWSETQVAQRLWLVSMLAGMVGIALALL